MARGNPKRTDGALSIELTDLRSTRRASEDTTCPGGMEAIFIRTRSYRLCNLAFHLHSYVIRQHQFFSGGNSQFRVAQDGRQHRYRGVYEQTVDSIFLHGELSVVIVIHVNGNAVSE